MKFKCSSLFWFVYLCQVCFAACKFAAFLGGRNLNWGKVEAHGPPPSPTREALRVVTSFTATETRDGDYCMRSTPGVPEGKDKRGRAH